MSHPRTFRLSDLAVQIVDSQDNKTQFVNEAIINSQSLPPDMKRCYRCSSILPLICFDKDRTKHNGVSGDCKNCNAIKRGMKK